jgi:hypothetical protein
MVSGSPVEKMLKTNEPRSEERNWMVRRRRPTGFRSSEMGFLDVAGRTWVFWFHFKSKGVYSGVGKCIL